MSECPTQRSIILREGDSYYKDEMEQEEKHIEWVDNFDKDVEVLECPCDGDVIVPNMLSIKVSIKEVLPQ